MKPFILMTATALALLLSPPAQARELSQGDAILGAAVALMFGLALKDIVDDKSTSQPKATPRRDPPVAHRTPPVRRVGPVPRNCLRHIQTRRGPVRLLGQRCLNRTYLNQRGAALPDRCQMQVRTVEGQRRQGYRPRCLRQAGFTIR